MPWFLYALVLIANTPNSHGGSNTMGWISIVTMQNWNWVGVVCVCAQWIHTTRVLRTEIWILHTASKCTCICHLYVCVFTCWWKMSSKHCVHSHTTRWIESIYRYEIQTKPRYRLIRYYLMHFVLSRDPNANWNDIDVSHLLRLQKKRERKSLIVEKYRKF